MEKNRHRLWLDFVRHLEFLKQTGFADPENRLTEDGFWASQLRLDQPLLIAEGIRKQAFEDPSPEILAGLIAAFVSDKPKEVEVDFKKISGGKVLEKALSNMMLKIEELRNLKLSQGFDSPPLQVWPCAALFIWSKGFSWEELLRLIEVEEGDMVMLVLRTADHLRQVMNLEKTHPSLAQKASQALPLILREPVIFY